MDHTKGILMSGRYSLREIKFHRNMYRLLLGSYINHPLRLMEHHYILGLNIFPSFNPLLSISAKCIDFSEFRPECLVFISYIKLGILYTVLIAHVYWF